MAGIPGPYLLVSHSFGSFIARVYAHEYPDQIVGMLMLDPSHEAFFPRWVEFYTQILNQLPAPTDTELPVLSDMRGYLTRISQGDPWESIPEGHSFYPTLVQQPSVPRTLVTIPLWCSRAIVRLRCRRRCHKPSSSGWHQFWKRCATHSM